MAIIRCVAFDFDGTLVRSNDIKRQSFYDAVVDIRQAGAELDKLFSSEFSGNRYDLLYELSKRLYPEKSIEEHQLEGARLAAIYGELCMRRIRTCEEVPGAVTVLEILKWRGIPAYIVSATPEIDLKPTVRYRDYEPHFKSVFGGPMGKIEHLNNIVALQGIMPSELLMVGDGSDDLAAAKATHCQFIGIANSGNPTLKGAECMIDDLRALPNLIFDGASSAAAINEGAGQ